MLSMTRTLFLCTLLAASAAAGPGPVTSQERPVVVIDAGHGGTDVGVEHEGLLEKDLVLAIAFVMGAEFVRSGYDVVYTRTRDQAVGWDDRRRIAEEAGASALLMLHVNGDEDPTRHGAEVYAFLDNAHSGSLARHIADALRASGSTVALERREWAFLTSPSVPTAMIELAFMTHPVEQRLLLRPGFQRHLGRTMVSAVTAFRPGG
jgi:N-acetylmuramoyl-L-alanine amidase